jgi:hypothetical protein
MGLSAFFGSLRRRCASPPETYSTKDIAGSLAFSLVLSGSFCGSALAQNGLPLPGNPSTQYVAQPGNAGAPAPSVPRYSAPVPGAPVAGGGGIGTSYERLPLNPGNAAARLEELRNMMSTARPKEFQDAIGEYSDWLSDMADAHWKLSQTFGKADSMKGQAESERQLCFKFGQLKRQSMLLKAEFLIKHKRFPEALAPLVDIVVAEPKTETGQNAYRMLKEIGFSEEATREASASGQH